MIFKTRVGNTAQPIKMRLIITNEMDYRKISERLETALVRFSMLDESTGIYKIANKQASIEVIDSDYGYPSKKQYLLVYCFTERDLDISKIYRGEFTIKFTDCDDVLNVPVAEKLYVNVGTSIGAYDD